MKKLLSIILSGALVASMAFTVSAKEKFTDFSKKNYSWAYDQVMDMVDKGYINGYDDDTFRPDNGVTRLEVLALFSRAMGALNEANEEILTKAVEMYKETLSSYELPWGEKEISYLLYRNVLTEEDLNTYLLDELKNEEMPRYEAAIIITKAMGGKKQATSSQSVSLDFTDVKLIPSTALHYVKFVSDNGIMTGMEDGSFSPKTSVLRSQMAVMLSRVDSKTGYETIAGKLTEVDTNARIITVFVDDEEYKYSYKENVLMKVAGEETVPKSMLVGVSAIITLSDNEVVFVDTFATTPDETVRGTFKGRATSSGKTKITIKDSKTKSNRSYLCSESVVVEYNNEPSTLTNFKVDDYVTLEIVNGVVEKIIGETKQTKIANAVIEEILLEPDFAMTISHTNDNYDGQTFEIADDVKVFKNDDTAEFSSIYVGDKATITFTYGVITAIEAYSTTKTVEGSIRQIIISASPSIVVNTKSGEETYAVANDADIIVNGEEGSLYDFRVGDSVKITLESQTVTRISTTTAQSASGKVEGTVTAVNTAYGFIKVSYKNEDDYTVEETVYCKDNTTTVMTADGATKKIKDLAEGQVVTIHGTSSNGAFSAKIIIISAE